jgi:hypothetical protein
MTGDFRVFLPLVIVFTVLGGAFLSSRMADVSGAQAATTSERCVRTASIASIKYIDPNTVNVEMRNGSTYTNTLRTSCNVHRFNGFRWRTVNGYLCKGDRIHAVRSGEACTLGPFEKQG